MASIFVDLNYWDVFDQVKWAPRHRGFKPNIFQLGPFFTTQLQIPTTFFWYELDPKLKLLWKGNTMKFKIGGVNDKKVLFFSTPKMTSKLTYETNLYFFPKKKLKKNSTFTPSILNFIALPFQNSFSFGSSSYQKKSSGDLKKLIWIFSIGLVGFHTNGWISVWPAAWLELACSVHSAIKVHL